MKNRLLGENVFNIHVFVSCINVVQSNTIV